MKSFLVTLLVLTSLNAYCEDIIDKYKLPAIACGASIIGATALNANIGIAGSVCAGIFVYHHYSSDMSNAQKNELYLIHEKHEQELKLFKEKMNLEYYAHREAMREIIVESVKGKELPKNGPNQPDITNHTDIKKIVEEMVGQQKEKIIDNYVKEVMGN